VKSTIIAKENDKVIGYLLAMTKTSRAPTYRILVPMFELFETIFYRDKKISDYNYLVVGQVCIDKAWRGQGVLIIATLPIRNIIDLNTTSLLPKLHATMFDH
jgi:hypothetical protein